MKSLPALFLLITLPACTVVRIQDHFQTYKDNHPQAAAKFLWCEAISPDFLYRVSMTRALHMEDIVKRLQHQQQALSNQLASINQDLAYFENIHSEYSSALRKTNSDFTMLGKEGDTYYMYKHRDGSSSEYGMMLMRDGEIVTNDVWNRTDWSTRSRPEQPFLHEVFENGDWNRAPATE